MLILNLIILVGCLIILKKNSFHTLQKLLFCQVSTNEKLSQLPFQ